jgi:hypothetical protein
VGLAHIADHQDAVVERERGIDPSSHQPDDALQRAGEGDVGRRSRAGDEMHPSGRGDQGRRLVAAAERSEIRDIAMEGDRAFVLYEFVADTPTGKCLPASCSPR